MERSKRVFTGLVTAIGEVVARSDAPGLVRLTIASPYRAAEVAIGASIAHAGCCLTVVERADAPGGMQHVVELGAETLARTTLGAVKPGAQLNLERSLRVGDELGGHWVAGHVDGLGRLASVQADGGGWRLEIEAPQALAPLIAPKGSIAVDGVSLTVNGVDGRHFGVLIIPHTWSVTTLSRLREGALVNLEADVLARYAARLLAKEHSA